MASGVMARVAAAPAASTSAASAVGVCRSAAARPVARASCAHERVGLAVSAAAFPALPPAVLAGVPVVGSQRGSPRLPICAALAEARGVDVVTTEREPGSAASAVEASESTMDGAVPKNGRTSLSSVTAVVADDMKLLQQSLMDLVGSRHPMLMQAAEQIFGAGGKRLRPALVFLAARATLQLQATGAAGEPLTLNWQHRRLAEVIEMIHTASLVHDDVLDDADQRRGAVTVHRKFNTRLAVLAGDYLFAQSSWHLANLDNLEVIKLISQVIADFANGEIAQAAALFNTELTLEDYLDKSFYKTASLIAASLKSAAIFSDVPPAVSEAMYQYGRHLGLAFQVVDDILDFTQDAATLGKPAGSDLASGNLTAPTLFALPKSARLREIVESEFEDEGSLAEALRLVDEVGGIEDARRLARSEADAALRALECLPICDARRGLEAMVDYVLERLY